MPIKMQNKTCFLGFKVHMLYICIQDNLNFIPKLNYCIQIFTIDGTNIPWLEIIEIFQTKITKQHSMEDGSDTKFKIKFGVQRKQNKHKHTSSYNCLSV